MGEKTRAYQPSGLMGPLASAGCGPPYVTLRRRNQKTRHDETLLVKVVTGRLVAPGDSWNDEPRHDEAGRDVVEPCRGKAPSLLLGLRHFAPRGSRGVETAGGVSQVDLVFERAVQDAFARSVGRALPGAVSIVQAPCTGLFGPTISSAPSSRAARFPSFRCLSQSPKKLSNGGGFRPAPSLAASTSACVRLRERRICTLVFPRS